MLRPGDVFAGYTIVRAIGGGRWGDLFLALHPSRSDQVVLEILPAGATAGLESHERFAVVDSGEFQGRLWLQYADGVDAAQPAGVDAEHDAARTSTDSVSPDPGDTDPDEPHPGEPPTAERSPRRRSPFVIAAALTAVGVVAAGLLFWNHNGTPATAVDPGLNGTYRFLYDDAKQTINGAPSPLPPSPKPDLSVTAFRSTCTPAGCVATGTKLDPHNPNAELNRWHRRRHPQRPVVSTVWRFTDGHWQLNPPYRFQSEEANCLGAGGKIAVGVDTAVTSKSLEPQDDGTLRGVETTTIITNDCGAEGQVYQVPFAVTRTGDVPPGVAVNDPARAPAPSPTTAAPTPVGGAELRGIYRLDVDRARAGGGPVGANAAQTHWWAVRSECASEQCVATAATLADERGKPSGGAAVLRFTGERWQSTPTLVASWPCGTGTGTASATLSMSLEPRPDGSLHGTETAAVLTNECGTAGSVSTTQIVATRAGDVPPTVVLADPTLFD